MPPFGLAELVVLVVLLAVVVAAWALIDVSRRPVEAFAAAGHSKLTWVLLSAAGVVAGIAAPLSVYYLTVVRPRVKTAQQAHAL